MAYFHLFAGKQQPLLGVNSKYVKNCWIHMDYEH